MKTRKTNSIKVAGLAILAIALLTSISCTSKQNNSSKENKQFSISKGSPKIPAMDIHAATFLGNIEAVREHINAGTDLNQSDDYGSTPLNTATLFGKTEVALLLIEAGADVNLKNGEGSTPLHTAAFFCRVEIVKALLSNGADKSIKNKYESTPLQSVAGPFNEVKAIYDHFSKDLGPLGLKLDYEYLELTRPVITEMLK